jgi:hypothetical protein
VECLTHEGNANIGFRVSAGRPYADLNSFESLKYRLVEIAAHQRRPDLVCNARMEQFFGESLGSANTLERTNRLLCLVTGHGDRHPAIAPIHPRRGRNESFPSQAFPSLAQQRLDLRLFVVGIPAIWFPGDATLIEYGIRPEAGRLQMIAGKI